jgi:metallophosphoesterase superfamily enzyme
MTKRRGIKQELVTIVIARMVEKVVVIVEPHRYLIIQSLTTGPSVKSAEVIIMPAFSVRCYCTDVLGLGRYSWGPISCKLVPAL